MRRFLAGIVALALCGCATPVWVKDGASEQDFTRDSYECERDARQSSYFGTGLVGAINMVEFQKRCMVARGWREQMAAYMASPGTIASPEPSRPVSTQVGAFPPVRSSGGP